MDVKLLLKSVQKNSRPIIAILICCCFNSCWAQVKFEIAYGEKISVNNAGAPTSFVVDGPSGEVHLYDEEINQFIFCTPGDYAIKVVQRHKNFPECDHLAQEMSVRVHPVRMRFDTQRLSLSEPIQENRETDKIVVSIPISIESFNHRPVKLSKAIVKSAGIGSSIVAIPNKSLSELPEGQHVLQYTLKGVATQNTYLMLDFVDANGQIQPALLSTPQKQ